MRDLHDLLAALRAEGVQLWLSDGRLQGRGLAGLSERRRRQLRDWKQELIAHLGQGGSEPRPAIIALSCAQQGLWFLDGAHRLGSAYNVVVAERLRGPLDLAALLRAFADLDVRHEVLRTRYPQENGIGMQEVLPPGGLDIDVVDLASGRPPGVADLQRLLQDEAEHPFAIEERCPFRCRLLRVSDDDHVLVLAMHHIVADASSISVLYSDLAELYAARRARRQARLPALAVQYADYALQQRRRVENGELDAQLGYWKQRLGDAPESLDLPADRPRPSAPSFGGGLVEFSWPAPLSERVLQAARRRRMTPFMLLLGAYQLLLARWSGQTDICVGTPMVVHDVAGTEGLIGYFLNTLVVRVSAEPELAVDAFLDHVRQRATEAYEHSEVPFDVVVASLRKRRPEGANPLFQTMFAYDEIAGTALALPGLEAERVLTELRTAKFDLSLYMSGGDVLRGGFEFATDLFDRGTIERLAGHFQVLTEALVGSVQGLIGDLPLLSAGQREQMLVTWNANALALPECRTLHGMIARRLAGHGARTAIMHDAHCMSHEDLDRASNQLAHRLIGMGVGPEQVVGVCMNRCPQMIVGLLGILKAGAAYVPLDPAYPPSRLAYMLSDSRARVLLSLEAIVPELPATDIELLCLDRESERRRIATQATSRPPDRARPANLAYIIYTSGSTGQPKGVAMPHSSATAFIAWAESAFGADAQAMAASTSICFDLSIFEIFLPLVSGGTIILIESATSLVEKLPAMLPRLLNTVPSAARALLNAGMLPKELQAINLAGEPLSRALVEALCEALPEIRVFNLYGPSEYATYSTWCHVPPDALARVGIGRPLANTRIYLLDARGTPTPVGTPGEIFVSGEGLARGYAHRAALTAARFVPDPFGPAGSRMYATGDVGRFRADGSIDYVGRLDQQVKIRGFRIEPGEIEARLRRCAGVVEAAVVPRGDRFGELQLVAHIVLDGPLATADALRTELARDLPSHMIPAVIDVREAMPMTPNGKVDRKALAAATLAGTIERAQYVAPRDATESLLAEVWADMLGLEHVGIDDNFFALGGHSLLASRIIARLRHGPWTQVSLRDLFVAPTVRQLAAVLVETRSVAPEALVPIDRSGPIETSFSQQRMWLIDQIDPQTGLYNVCIAWRLTGDLDVAALHRSLAEIRRRHEVLRTVFRGSDDGPPVQLITDPPPLPMPVVDLSTEDDPEAAVNRWLKQDAAQPFDLACGPLFRAVLVRLGDQQHILQLGMPHIVADGWSLDVILSELGALYPAFLQAQASPLAPLPIQYGDFAHWERRALRGTVLEGHMRYARELLADAPQELVLPWDRPRPAASTYQGDVVEIVLDAALSEELRQVARRFQVTLFMLLASVFDVILYRYSGQQDFCIGYSVGNRGRVETEGLIGAFVNVLVHRARLDAADPFATHLARVREGMLDADAHMEFPFEKMVEELSPERDLARHPIFQVTYSYSTTHGPRTRRTRTLRGVGEREVSLTGLALGLVEPGYSSAKFDLAMFVSDTGDVLEGDLEFSTDLFDRSTIERLARQVDALCRAVVANPRELIGNLNLLSPAERNQMLHGWNSTALPLDATACLHDCFQRQVARNPEAIALEAGPERLSYAELNCRANRLAHRLRRLGVRPESRVAVCVGRRAELVVCLLGVLKAGGAYVPLDPSYPPAVLAHAMRHASATVLLAGKQEAHLLPEHDGQRVLVAGGQDDWASELADDPSPLATAQHLAYCLFTSGSTGSPKAVALAHSSAVALLEWAGQAFGDAETSRVLACTSVCFDLSVFEIFVPLARGGCVLLVEDVAATATSAAAPSLVNTVPSSVRALLAERALPDSVRTINIAGEVLAPALVKAIEASAPGARILNLYGPTESTTYATFAEVGGGRQVTIGRPIANTCVYILDGNLEPTPIGVPGQLHIAGSGLARGYLGQPALTAAGFVPNPFGPPGSRMYATGDVARYLADGRIEFCGRADQQIKLHGFRIELAEVEQGLRRCAGVADAAVVMASPSSDNACLAGFVTTVPGVDMTAQSLSDDVSRLLPRHMVPSRLAMLADMPRTPTGKVDRQALLRMGVASTGQREIAPTPPATASELLIAQVWQDLLDRQVTDTRESFFSLGGHSIAAIRMVARVAAATGVTLPLRAVFEHPTIAALAAHVDSSLQRPGLSQEPEPIPVLDRSRAARAVSVTASAETRD